MKQAARRIVEKLRQHGHEAFFAGGCVRDFLLRRKPNDIDIATSALPDEVLRLFPRSLAIGAKFGVIQVRMYGHSYEVATFRSDKAYLDGRHPSAVEFTGPEQDALRRDFTVNGLFYDPVAGRVIDYVHGKADIQKRSIRTIGDPSARFAEDKLRILRAVRLCCFLDFNIEKSTWLAIQKCAPDILQVSRERIRDELIRIFTGLDPYRGLDLLQSSGLLFHILPEVESTRGIPQTPEFPLGPDVFNHTQVALMLLHKPSVILAFATLLHDVGKPRIHSENPAASPGEHARIGGEMSREICRRLRMSNSETDQIADLVAAHMDFPQIREMRESAVKRLLSRPNIAEHLELLRVNSLSNHRTLDAYICCLDKIKEYGRTAAAAPLINGDDLIQMGYAPGPIFNEILQAVEDLQLEGVLRTREEALEHVRRNFPLSNPAPS
ncbi:MAG: CCA tRNA nucleotidyltransferase [Acidobacteria bacterium]|nr:CCA tRNA nucleotidyltransferase [Acidobacteriota bacterium]